MQDSNLYCILKNSKYSTITIYNNGTINNSKKASNTSISISPNKDDAELLIIIIMIIMMIRIMIILIIIKIIVVVIVIVTVIIIIIIIIIVMTIFREQLLPIEDRPLTVDVHLPEYNEKRGAYKSQTMVSNNHEFV